jgi:hypothetical protein
MNNLREGFRRLEFWVGKGRSFCGKREVVQKATGLILITLPPGFFGSIR